MKGKPNPVLHMLLWGFGSGTILALLFIIFFVSWGASLSQTLSNLINPIAWSLALQFGGIPGASLGLLTGLLLWVLSRGFQEPFSKAEMQRQRYKVYLAIGGLTTISGYILTTILFWSTLFTYGWGLRIGGQAPFPLAFFFPPIIAGIAAAYAAHRYMFRLRLWSEQEYGLQKEKEKNFEHLEDKAKNEVIEDDETEKRQYKSS